MGDTELFILENLKCLACKMSKKVTRQTAFYGQVWMLETKAGFLPGADFVEGQWCSGHSSSARLSCCYFLVQSRD